MPRRDGTGPIGTGLMRGQRTDTDNIDNRNFDRCFGGYGCQRGHRRHFTQTGIPGYLRNGYSRNITKK